MAPRSNPSTESCARLTTPCCRLATLAGVTSSGVVCSRIPCTSHPSRNFAPPAMPKFAGTLQTQMKSFHVTTFGCQMNEHDSERMKGMLESLGYAEAPQREDADLILFNTCSIREKADERFVSHLHEAKILKKHDPERIIGVGGCWAQS